MLIIDNENDAYIELLCGHLDRFTRRLRAIPAEKWEWQPNPFTPSPRVLAQHAWLWLLCDRNHIHEPDAQRHPPVPEPPAAQAELCALLDREAAEWRTLLRAMSPGQLAETRYAFNWRRVNVRWLVWHMCQNVIYKHGQLAALYFQLGLDGEEPYQPPFPNDDYRRLVEMVRHPSIRWVVSGDAADTLPSEAQVGINERDHSGCTALHYAVWRGDHAKVHLLLENGADVNEAYGEGWTALMDAAWLGYLEIVRILLAHGAEVSRRTARGFTALDFAAKEGHTCVVDTLKEADG